MISSSDEPVSRVSSFKQVEDLRLHGDVERGRRLVGDDQARLAGERHGDHHALAHAAGILVRVGREPARRVGNAHAAEQLLGRVERLAPRERRDAG